MGSTLKEEEKEMITIILVKNSDMFAWTTADMPGIDPRIISHKLSVCEEAKLVAKKKRRPGGERMMIAENEVHKLLKAKFIREIHYTTWLTNIVLVQKKNRKWWMCMTTLILTGLAIKMHTSCPVLTDDDFLRQVHRVCQR